MKPVFFDTASGRRTALLVSEGRKFNHLIVMDSSGLTITKVATAVQLDEIEKCSDPLGKFKSAAKQFGCTKGAAQHLGLKNAIPTPKGEGKNEDRTPPAKKTPVRPGQGVKATGKKRPAAKKTKPASKVKAAEKSTSKAASKAALFDAVKLVKAKKIKTVQDLRTECDKTWQIGADRAHKRLVRLSREIGFDLDSLEVAVTAK